jgi:hypothetical protein
MAEPGLDSGAGHNRLHLLGDVDGLGLLSGAYREAFDPCAVRHSTRS